MSESSKRDNRSTEYGGLRPGSDGSAKSLSGLRPDQVFRHDGARPSQAGNANGELAKGSRPIQEGHRPVQSQPQGSLGPVGDQPGSGVRPKK